MDPCWFGCEWPQEEVRGPILCGLARPSLGFSARAAGSFRLPGSAATEHRRFETVARAKLWVEATSHRSLQSRSTVPADGHSPPRRRPIPCRTSGRQADGRCRWQASSYLPGGELVRRRAPSSSWLPQVSRRHTFYHIPHEAGTPPLRGGKGPESPRHLAGELFAGVVPRCGVEYTGPSASCPGALSLCPRLSRMSAP